MPDPADPTDAEDLSVVIPFRLDRPERAENLRAVLRNLHAVLPRAEIVLLEDGPDLTAGEMARMPGVVYRGTRNAGGFHRTRLLNEGIAELATRPFAASYDTDALVYPAAFHAALSTLRHGDGYVFPYDGRFLNVAGATRAALIATPDLAALPAAEAGARAARRGDDVSVMAADSVGGVVLFDRAAFVEAGGYHEQFRYWGFEDAELVARFAKFGHAVRRMAGYPLIHLAHPRGHRADGWYSGTRANKVLAARMARLDRPALQRLIAAGGLKADAPAPAPPTPLEWLRALLT